MKMLFFSFFYLTKKNNNNNKAQWIMLTNLKGSKLYLYFVRVDYGFV